MDSSGTMSKMINGEIITIMQSKKRAALTLLLLVVICIMAAVIRKYSPVTLIINGTVQKTLNAEVRVNSARLSFSEVLSGLGYKKERIDAETVAFSEGGTTHLLLLTKKAICQTENNDNILQIPPGCRGGYMEFLDDDVILDDETMQNVLYVMGKKVIIDWNYIKNSIYITD